MYRITYEQGNGYSCGCCRQTSTQTEDCETTQDVINWLSELEACKTITKYSDDDDRSVIEIREIKDADLTNEFRADPELTAKIIQTRQDNVKKRKEIEDEARLQIKKKQLADLKKELGDIN